jgi:hypothetical protein
MLTSRIIFYLFLMLVVCGCSSGSDSGSTSPTYLIDLDFQRVDSSTPNPFTVTATIRENGRLKSGIAADVDIVLGQGSANAVTEISTGQYQFTVTPVQTGEHEVTISYGGVSKTATALVVAGVHAGWGQPMSVSGLVNTAGYEDGVTITPDGEYLFVQYGPIYFSGIQLFVLDRASGGCGGDRLSPSRCTHEWIDSTIGPYTGPERPGFFDGRFSGTTQLHNAASWGLGDEEAFLFAPSTMFYGFKKQADGSFAEPFYLAFEDENDGIINAYGLSFMLHGDGTATALYTINDPTDPDMVDLNGDGSEVVESFFDVFTSEITLGQDTNLGTFVASGTPGTPPMRGAQFPSRLVNFGKTGINGIAGTQGNPHLYASGGTVQSIWTDDEHDARIAGSDRGDVSAYVRTAGSFPDATWSKVILPSVINQPSPVDETQPFFTGSGLYFTRISDVALPEIYYSACAAGTQSVTDFSNAGNWTTPEVILSVDNTGFVGNADDIGKVTAIGEPTIANVGGTEYLYFVYGIIRGYDATSGLADINMQAGFVKKK